MQPAADEMEEALAHSAMAVPSIPLVANVTASAVSDANAIRDLLVEQVTGTVRWRESVLYMKDQGVTELIEIGHGKVLTGLARRIDKELGAQSIGTPESIDEFMKAQ
jgi:[acyl-carrier-protein] S-malonyltransferase